MRGKVGACQYRTAPSTCIGPRGFVHTRVPAFVKIGISKLYRTLRSECDGRQGGDGYLSEDLPYRLVAPYAVSVPGTSTLFPRSSADVNPGSSVSCVSTGQLRGRKSKRPRPCYCLYCPAALSPLISPPAIATCDLRHLVVPLVDHHVLVRPEDRRIRRIDECLPAPNAHTPPLSAPYAAGRDRRGRGRDATRRGGRDRPGAPGQPCGARPRRPCAA
eukprot:525748-Rhodomonas_salina.1